MNQSFVRTTRESYDLIAADYTDTFGDDLDRRPFDRAMLTTFAELVRGSAGGLVADVGCGFGHLTAYLTGRGQATIGIDLSRSMIRLARERNPALRFAEGSMTALPLQDESLGGVVAMYSLIHIPPPSRPAVLEEFLRVLRPDGVLLLGFQAGDDETRHYDEGFGHRITLDFHRLSPDRLAEQLKHAGFELGATLVREPYDSRESTQQAYLIAHKTQKLRSQHAHIARRGQHG